MTKNPALKYTIEALYLGERFDPMRGVFQEFRQANGAILKFAGVKGCYFGTSYLVTKNGEIKTRPIEIAEEKQTLKPTDKERAEFEAFKVIVSDYRIRRRKAMELKKPHRDIVRAVELLKPFTRQLDGYELSRFMGYVQNQLSKKRKKK